MERHRWASMNEFSANKVPLSCNIQQSNIFMERTTSDYSNFECHMFFFFLIRKSSMKSIASHWRRKKDRQEMRVKFTQSITLYGWTKTKWKPKSEEGNIKEKMKKPVGEHVQDGLNISRKNRNSTREFIIMERERERDFQTRPVHFFYSSRCHRSTIYFHYSQFIWFSFRAGMLSIKCLWMSHF